MVWIGLIMLVAGVVWHSRGNPPPATSGMNQANWLAIAGFCIACYSAYSNVDDRCGRGDDMACADLDDMQNP